MFEREHEERVQQLESHSHAVVRLKISQATRLAHVLSRAFHEEPQFTYMLPDKNERSAALPWILNSVIRASHLNGESYTTADIEGGALWIGPGRTFAFQQLLPTEAQSFPLELDTESFERCVKLSAHLTRARQQLVRTPHWYLIALGVEPSRRGRGIREALIQPVLSRADVDRVPCYVEAFHEQHLAFYGEHGFRIEGSGSVCRNGPAFWAMTRLPGTKIRQIDT